MDYFDIVKRAYEMTIKHRFLWIFGVFAGGAVGINSFNYNFPSSSTNKDSNLSASDVSTIEQFFTNNWEIIFLIVAVLITIALLLFIFNIISQGALVASAEKIEKSEKTNFHKAFAWGAHQFWRVWGMYLIYLLMVLATLIVLVVPVSILIINQMYVFAVVWGILLFVVCLLFWIMIGLISPISLRVVVLENKGVFESIRHALHLFQANWVNFLVMYLIVFAISIAYGIALMLALGLAGVILFAIGYGVYLANQPTAFVYGGLVGLALILTVAVISGAYNSFNSCILTLTYLKLRKS